MNKTSMIVQIVVFFAITVVMAYLVTEKRFQKNAPHRLTLGYDRFMADILWIELIQELGGANCIDSENAEYFYRKFDDILRLNPEFWKVAHVGGLHLGLEVPKETLKLLAIGAEHNPTDWKLPYLAAFVTTNYLDSGDEAKELADAKMWLQRAIDNGAPDYADRFMKRLKAGTAFDYKKMVRARREKAKREALEQKKTLPVKTPAPEAPETGTQPAVESPAAEKSATIE
jgi:hypothetical protein